MHAIKQYTCDKQMSILTSLLYGSNRVTSSNDSNTSLACELSEGGCDRIGALGESVELEDSHWAIPDDSLAVGQACLKLGDGLGALYIHIIILFVYLGV